MDAPTPDKIKLIEFSQNDKKIEKLIKGQTDLYTIQIGKHNTLDNLVIKVIPEKSKNVFFYSLNSNLSELQNTSDIFKYYASIDKILLGFEKFNLEVMEKEDDLSLNIIMFNPSGETIPIELGLEKNFESQNNLINYINNLSKKIHDLNTTIYQKDKEIENLKTINLQKDNNILSLQTTIDNLNKNISEYQKKEQNLNCKISYLNQEKINLSQMVTNLKNEIQQEKTKYNELEKTYRQSRNEYSELSKKYELLKQEYENGFKADKSNILSSMNKLKFITNYIKIKQPSFSFNEIKLLYRGSIHGDRTKTCHKYCDNKQNVLIFIKTDTEIVFGGYSKIGFRTSNKATYLIDNDCFLFSVDFEKIFPCIENKRHISHISDICGLCFTGSLCFFDNFMSSYDNCIYKTIQEYFNRLDEPYEMNGGKSNFRCRELEVYQLI